MLKRVLFLTMVLLIPGSLVINLPAQEYIIVGWSDVGLHETNKSYQTMGLHPPYNNIRAQVLRLGTAGALPRVVIDGIRVEYEIPGNTYSAGKNDFWTYVESLFGITLPDNVGLTNAGLNGTMSKGSDSFWINGIPLTPYVDSDLSNANPYQLALLKVYNEAGDLLASAQPVLPVSNETGCSKRGCHSSEQNILMRHENEGGFDPGNTPVQCSTCHASSRIGAEGVPGLESLSEVVHSVHIQRANDCYDCHAGDQTEFYRGVMSDRGLGCTHCHGNLGTIAESIRNGRRPWIDEPTCASESCHGPEYGQEAGKLYKDSKGHGGVYCSACHGSPHAIYPSKNMRDNIQIVALQGAAGTLTDCGVCHLDPAPGPGPHGILPYAAEFESSLHKNRQGIQYGYAEENGGFEGLTDIALGTVSCLKCHAQTLADGTPIDDATYTPFCYDCHNPDEGAKVAQETCLGCHDYQRTEIDLAADIDYQDIFSDVHRDAGMVCTDCHSRAEMHGDGNVYNSMHETGAVKTSCDNDNCHPLTDLKAGNVFHIFHVDNIYCSACHVKTVQACNSCHFESLVAGKTSRFYGQIPQNNFVMLVNSLKHGKVTTASYQTITYGDKTFYAIAPFHGHTVARNGRLCLDCHDNPSVLSYFESGKIRVTQWDNENTNLVSTSGVIPVPPAYDQSLQFDFVTFTGSVNDPVDAPFNPLKWTFLKSQADATQLLFVTPLTTTQMNALHFIFTSAGENDVSKPQTFSLAQNNPNPFNLQTAISFRLPRPEKVSLTVYNSLGQEIRSLTNDSYSAGEHSIIWNATDNSGKTVGSGIYICMMKAGIFQTSRKMVLIK